MSRERGEWFDAEWGNDYGTHTGVGLIKASLTKELSPFYTGEKLIPQSKLESGLEFRANPLDLVVSWMNSAAIQCFSLIVYGATNLTA